MVDQLSSFADEVTRVAREVGTEGKLGGQAEVEGVSRHVARASPRTSTSSPRTSPTRCARSPTSSTAVTQGDLTRQITVEAAGEVAELKDRINQMIANLRDTTQQNAEQDWLKTNLARISRPDAGPARPQRGLAAAHVARSRRSSAPSTARSSWSTPRTATAELRLVASYGYKRRKNLSNEFQFGEGLPGQAALEMKSILVTNAPAGLREGHVRARRGAPVNLMVLPILFEEQVLAVIELASLHAVRRGQPEFLDQLSETIGVVLSTIIANNRTEDLLEEQRRWPRSCSRSPRSCSPSRTSSSARTPSSSSRRSRCGPPRSCCRPSRRSCARPTRSCRRRRRCWPSRTATSRSRTPRSSGRALALEERAEQLSLSSRYKCEFLANMSHELRTPLNSLLILSKLLADNPDGTSPTSRSSSRARSTRRAPTCCALISDILDLSKVEAGKMEVHPAPLDWPTVLDGLERSFRPVAEEKGLELRRRVAGDPPADDRLRRAARAADPAQPALQRAEVHRDGQRRGSRVAPDRRARPRAAAPYARRLHGHRHRHRHRRGQAAADLRGLPAGRRDDQPPLRRHRASACRSAARSRACSAARSASTSTRGRGLGVHAAAARDAAAGAPIRRRATEASPRRCPSRCRRRAAPATAPLPVADDREQMAQGDRVALIVDSDVDRCDRPARRRPRSGLQGPRGDAPGDGARARAGAPARRDPARPRRRASSPRRSAASSATRARATCLCSRWPTRSAATTCWPPARPASSRATPAARRSRTRCASDVAARRPAGAHGARGRRRRRPSG